MTEAPHFKNNKPAKLLEYNGNMALLDLSSPSTDKAFGGKYMKFSKLFPILNLALCLLLLADCAQPVTNVIQSQAVSPATGPASSNPADANSASAGQSVVQDSGDPLPAGSQDFTLTSEAFQNSGEIPNDFIAKNSGGNISIPLSWSNVPPGTGSFAIQMVDLNFRSPPFVHWAISDIPATSTDLPAGIDAGNDLVSPREAIGANQAVDYRGPNPPSLHNYEITIYAIRANAIISLGEDSALNKAQLESNSLGKSVLVGTVQ